MGKAGIDISRYVDISKWLPETPRMSGVALIEGHLHQPSTYSGWGGLSPFIGRLHLYSIIHLLFMKIEIAHNFCIVDAVFRAFVTCYLWQLKYVHTMQ